MSDLTDLRDRAQECRRNRVPTADAHVIPEPTAHREHLPRYQGDAPSNGLTVDKEAPDPSWHLDPQDIAARGARSACPGGKSPVDGVCDALHLRTEGSSQPVEMPIVPTAIEQLRDGHLL